jgi:hypothetical protein
MSEKLIPPPLVEQAWQRQDAHHPRADNEAWQRNSEDNKSSKEDNSNKSSVFVGHQIQNQELQRESVAHRLGGGIREPDHRRNRPVPSLLDTTSAGSKLSEYAGREVLGHEPFHYPRLADTSALYRSTCDPVYGTEQSQSDMDDKEPSVGQDAEFDVEDEDVDDNERDGQSRSLTMADHLAARRKMKRFRYSHDPNSRP